MQQRGGEKDGKEKVDTEERQERQICEEKEMTLNTICAQCMEFTVSPQKTEHQEALHWQNRNETVKADLFQNIRNQKKNEKK